MDKFRQIFTRFAAGIRATCSSVSAALKKTFDRCKASIQDSSQKQLTNAQIFHFFEQLQALIGAGITPYAALQIMQKDGGNAQISSLLDWMSAQLESGRPLSATARDSQVFPSYVCELLAIGEQTGNVEDVCGALAQYYADEDELRDAIRSAVSYPLVMIVMMFAVIIVLLVKVMPVFSLVFAQLGTSVSGVTQMLMRLSASLSRYSALIIILLILCTIAFLYFFLTQKGQKQFVAFFASFPLTRRFAEDLALTRFASGLKMTAAAGIDPYTSLDLTSRIVENDAIREKIAVCRDLMLSGDSFSEAIAKAEMFDNFYSSMITVFAHSGSVDRAMEFIAKQYKADTDKRISRTLSSIEPTMVAVLSVIVGMILLSVILPLMSIMANIG